MEDQTLLLKHFGDTPILRVIDFFIENPLFDYSREEILANLSIARKTLFKIWCVLEESGIVVMTRKVGKAKMYRLNRESEVVKKLIELDMALGKQAMMKAVEADKKRREEALSVLQTVNHER